MIDAIGQRYGVRPSAILGIDDPTVAFQFDSGIALRALQDSQANDDGGGNSITAEDLYEQQKAAKGNG